MMDIQQEPERIPARPLLGWFALVLAVIALSAVLSVVLARAPKATALQRGKRARVSEEPAPRLPSPPERSELEAAPFEEETAAERKARDARSKLTRFGWTDRARGRVHVPLEVALDLYLGAQGHSP